MVITSFLLGAHLLWQNAAFQFTVQGLAKAPAPTATVATVNGVEIKAKDVEDLLWDLHGTTVLKDIIYYNLFITEARKRGIVVTQEEVDKGVAGAIDEIKQGLTAGQTVEQAMAQQGQTRSLFAVRIKSNLALTKIALADFNPKDYIKISTIVVRPNSAAATDVANAIQVVQKAYDRIKAGEKWDKLVDELTVEQAAKQNRGFLGWRNLSLFPKEALSEIETLKKGDITKPVHTSNGIQMFRIEDKGDAATKEEIEIMKNENIGVLRQQVGTKILQSAKIEYNYPPKIGG